MKKSKKKSSKRTISKKTEKSQKSVKEVAIAEEAPVQLKNTAKKAIIENIEPVKVSFIKKAWQSLIDRQVLQKVFTLLFALVVFGALYYKVNNYPHRKIMTYLGVMLLMVMVYAELLVIRDHLWVIEGSMRESRKWRDIFFSQANMRKQRLRKLIAAIFAMATFSFVYIKVPGTEIFSFFGLILMITVLYYEILTVRDEVHVMGVSLKAKQKVAEALTEEILDGEMEFEDKEDIDPDELLPE